MTTATCTREWWLLCFSGGCVFNGGCVFSGGCYVSVVVVFSVVVFFIHFLIYLHNKAHTTFVHRAVHNDTLRILRFAIDEFIGGETTAKANEFVDIIMERLFQFAQEPTIGGAPPSPLPEHLAKGAKKVLSHNQLFELAALAASFVALIMAQQGLQQCTCSSTHTHTHTHTHTPPLRLSGSRH